MYETILIQAHLSTNCLERASAAATSSVHSSLYEQIFTVTLDLSVQACKLMLHGACCIQCRVDRVQPATHSSSSLHCIT